MCGEQYGRRALFFRQRAKNNLAGAGNKKLSNACNFLSINIREKFIWETMF